MATAAMNPEQKTALAADVEEARQQAEPTTTTTTSHYDPQMVRNSLIAGSVAGVTSTLACHPFDVIRTKMQAASMTSSTPSNPLRVVSQTFHNGGLRALYTGLALPLAAQAVYKATIFTVHNVTQQTLTEWNSTSSNTTKETKDPLRTLQDQFVCGFVAGGVNAAFFVTPVEFVRNQLIKQHSLQVQQQQPQQPSQQAAFSGPLSVVRHTIRQAGIRGLWKGIGVTVARDSIGVGFFFASMQWCQDYFKTTTNNNQQPQKPSLTTTILSGAVAGLTYWIVALPLDSVKTWVQSDMADSAFQAVRTSLETQGLRQTLVKLFAGFQVAYARGIPSAAITVTTYSLCYQAVRES